MGPFTQENYKKRALGAYIARITGTSSFVGMVFWEPFEMGRFAEPISLDYKDSEPILKALAEGGPAAVLLMGIVWGAWRASQIRKKVDTYPFGDVSRINDVFK